MKIGRDEVFMVPVKCCCFSARSTLGRIQGGAKIGHWDPLLEETSSSDRKATIKKHVGRSVVIFCSIPYLFR